MMHRSHADNPRTGTTVFQTSDEALTYVERLVDAEIEFVEPPASVFDPTEVLYKHLGGQAC
jgi:hypothetical protein